jgi:AcrR family transcriptional regulator
MSAEERRSAIVAAVAPLVTEYGAAVTTRESAKAAGIAEGTIFRVFPDKRALFRAVAEETVNPSHGAEHMAATLATVPDLRDKVVCVVEQMVARTRQATTMMMALRGLLAQEPAPDQPPGPPAFLVEANRRLLRNLEELVFAPHREELRVPPAVAARLLRSLVFGAWHPGMEADEPLSAEQVADALLDGVRRTRRRRGEGRG